MNSHEGLDIGKISEDWVEGMFPYLSSSRIAPINIYDILDSLSNLPKGTLFLNDYHSRGPPTENTEDGRWGSQKNWDRQKYDRKKLDESISADGKVLDSVRIEMSDSEDSFKATMSKNGHLTYYAGGKKGFTTFYRLLLETYISKSIEHHKSLEMKEATISPIRENVIHPIEFQSSGGLFTVTQFDQIIAALKQQSEYNVAVLHKGNPWLSMSVVDRSDGSSVQIFGFDKKVKIIPMIRASPESLARIEDLIYEVFTSARKIRKD